MKPTPTQIQAFAALAEEELRKAGYKESTAVNTGKKYAKIVSTVEGNGGTGVHSFIDMSTGDILKAASWQAPAKGIRGNITNPDGGRSALYPTGHPYGGRVISHR